MLRASRQDRGLAKAGRVAAAAVLAIGAAGAALAAPAYATKAAFQTAVVGKTIASTTKKGKPFVAHYAANGTGDLTISGDKPQSFTWTFKGEVLCSTFKAWNFTECNRVVIKDPAAVDFIDAKSGALNNSYTVQ